MVGLLVSAGARVGKQLLLCAVQKPCSGARIFLEAELERGISSSIGPLEAEVFVGARPWGHPGPHDEQLVEFF
jgi:hypothetical protein